jgi:hypothetical protein
MTKSEDRIQADCTTWAHNTYPHLRLNWWHVPNGGTRSIIEARKLKTMGVKAGVWDIHCYYNRQFSIIEMKTETGTYSPEQKVWGAEMKRMGANLYLCRSLDDFQKAFAEIFNPLPI